MQPELAHEGIEAFTPVASMYETWFASPLGAFVDQQEMHALACILQGVLMGPFSTLERARGILPPGSRDEGIS